MNEGPWKYHGGSTMIRCALYKGGLSCSVEIGWKRYSFQGDLWGFVQGCRPDMVVGWPRVGAGGGRREWDLESS